MDVDMQDLALPKVEFDEAVDPKDGTVERKKKPWEREGGRIKKKKVPGAKNVRIRKYVKPKSALECLNGLQAGLNYVTEPRSGHMPICVTVVVNGQKYKGLGSTKTLARQAAAEAALTSFVKAPSEIPNVKEDDTPWAALASFALFKLFNDWREGRVGMVPPSCHAMDFAFPRAIQTENSMVPPPLPPAVNKQKANGSESSNPKRARTLPDNAATIHPSVVLNQMRPNIQYNIEISTQNNQKSFTATATIDEQQFIGEGTKVKMAKFQLAKQANLVLFNVESTFEMGKV